MLQAKKYSNITFTRLLVGVVGLFFLTQTATAGLITQSTFDASDEGWTVGDFFGATGSSTPTYVATGGNPGGFIRTSDLFSWNAYHAPGAFLGNQSAAYGGNLHIDQQILSSDGANYPMAVISDGALLLQFRTTPPGTSWTSYNIGLLASSGWEVAPLGQTGGPGVAATEAQLQQVLSNLAFLNIQADWQSGSDQVDLDNVRLESPNAPTVPEPGTFALFGIGASGLFGFRRSLRKYG